MEILTDTRNLIHCVIEDSKAVEEPEIGKQRIHGDRSIATMGKRFWQKEFTLIEQIAHETMKSQNHQILIDELLRFGMMKERINLMLPKRDRD